MARVAAPAERLTEVEASAASSAPRRISPAMLSRSAAARAAAASKIVSRPALRLYTARLISAV